MNNLASALWAETLKARRSKVPLVSAIGFSFAPLAGALFMVILKDPEAARSMGLISVKAQITVGSADWPAMFNLLSQAVAIGGAILFGIITIWAFGREFSDRTAKDLLALPTSRTTIVTAKCIVIAVWSILALTLFVIGTGLIVGKLVDIPGWSMALLGSSLVDILGASLFTIALLPFVALITSMGRGYLLPFGWVILTMMLAQIVAITGWGDYFPWAIPALFSVVLPARALTCSPRTATSSSPPPAPSAWPPSTTGGARPTRRSNPVFVIASGTK